jgi:hypothetical protein
MKYLLQHIKVFIPVLLAFVMSVGNSAAQTIISNGPEWYDTNGNIIEGHGGGFLKVGAVYYWFGTDKSANSNAFTSINCYASNDLISWEFRNAVVTNATHEHIGNYVGNRVIERPKVIYNDSTGKYVMWAHWDWSNYGEAEAVVFQCDSVDGDYEMVDHFRPFDNMARDCGLYKLDDGTAYFFAAANNNADMVLYKLRDDYLDVEEQTTTLWPGSHRESPVVFQSNNAFFFLSSGTTGWAPNQARIATSSSIEGPWSGLSNFGNYSTFDSQPTYVFSVEGTEDTTYIYCGDRWKDPGLNESKYIWLPIQDTPDGLQIEYFHQWSLNMEKGTWTEIRDSILLQENWQLVTVDSEDTFGNPNIGIHAFDGDPSTFWHTEWKFNQPSHPHEIQIDLGSTASVYGFRYLPRQDNNVNGTITNYEFYCSMDLDNWEEPLISGELSPGNSEKNILFDDTVLCRYIRLVSLAAVNDSPFASMAEFKLLGLYGSTTGVSAKSLEEDAILVYPNPHNGTTIKLKINMQFNNSLSVSIYNLNGTDISNQKLHAGEQIIHCKKKLAPGIYTIVVKSENSLVMSRKLVVI